MKRAALASIVTLLLVVALVQARDDKPEGRPLAPQAKERTGASDAATSLGILKLYTALNRGGDLLQADPAPRVFVDGEFVGNYYDLTHNTPAHFRLPAGKHKVRVEVVGYKTFESDVHLIGNETSQYLAVSLTKQ
jgi:hypothetical protein